jgi:hypothetical protein
MAVNENSVDGSDRVREAEIDKRKSFFYKRWFGRQIF